MQISTVRSYLEQLQDTICNKIASLDGGATFHEDLHQQSGINGKTRILHDGTVFEQAGVNFSYVSQNKLPKAATTKYPELAGAKFEAMGVSLVIHPKNPYVPTTHLNVRLFVAYPENNDPLWWFGGGFDLTPFYVFEEDCKHWHQIAYNLCKPFGENVYQDFKEQCDEYFYIKHRKETRGIGGLFFDNLNIWDFAVCFDFIRAVGDGFLDAYVPIVNKRKDYNYGERERNFQLYRRSRYVEFNLVYDRGTLFGLQAGGRTESILMSLPPIVNWRYNFKPEQGSEEAKLYNYLSPRGWLESL